MQIKKGPFGYYAMEKFDSPDRLCSYAEEVIAGNRSDFYLPPTTEYIGSGILCCFEFSGYVQVTDPEFSVFSSGKKFTSRKKEAKFLNMRRRAAGDLFTSFIKLLDSLVSPSCIVLDPDMIFTDTEGIAIKLCCLPLKISPDELCLSSLGASRLEKLLNCDFFKSILTEDEINALVFSVKENNEDMFLKIAGIIKGTDEESDALPSGNPKEQENTSSSKKISKTEKDLLVSVLSAGFAFVLLIRQMDLPCLLFFFLSALILVVSLLGKKKHKENIEHERSQEISRQRSSVLFSDNALLSETERQDTDNLNTDPQYGTVEQPQQLNPLLAGRLSLISDIRGIEPQYSVYLDETYIGSDCFLSDIVLDDPQVSPLHAVIKQENGSFYLMPSNGKGKTYIEDSPLENGRTYEIKSGQKITIGDIEFRFGTEKVNKTEY